MNRLLIYWAASLLFITLPLALVNTLLEPNRMFFHHLADVYLTHWPLLAMMLIIIPFALRDAVRFSNRFVGPIYRLRMELQRFEDGERLRTFQFRKNDFWCDLADGMNLVTERLNELEDEQVAHESAATV